MKLFYSTTSPYVRKVRMFIIATEFESKIEEVLVNPFESEDLKKTNPLGKIPVLIDKDLTLVESGLICEYLDDKFVSLGGKSLFHKNQQDYYPLQLLHVIANGIIDAAVATLLENRRQDSEQSASQKQKWYGQIRRAIETLQKNAYSNYDKPNIGTIALASALGYLDFRFNDFGWRDWNAELADWHKTIENTNWYSRTIPH